MENPPFEDVFLLEKVNFHCHVSLLEGMIWEFLKNYNLVGGFNPSEKYLSKWESSPGRGEN